MAGPIFAWKKSGSGEMELEIPEKKVPSHPDNNRLEKRVSGDDYSPFDNGRRCTDIVFLLPIICSAATGLIE